MTQMQTHAVNYGTALAKAESQALSKPASPENVERTQLKLKNFSDIALPENDMPGQILDKIKGAGNMLGKLGAIAGPAVFALDGFRLGQAVSDDGGKPGACTSRTVGALVGGLGGEFAGAAIGGPIGQIMGGIVGAFSAGPIGWSAGEVIGGAGGALVGSVVGSLAGSNAGKGIAERVFHGTVDNEAGYHNGQ